MKDYHDPELQKMLETKITAEKYKENTPLLQEIMQRRSFEFGFSIERMEKETDNLVKNLNKIEFTNGIDKTLPSNIAAIYNSKDKEIVINKEMIQKEKTAMEKYSTLSPENLKIWVGQQIFETVTHEVYHAITTWEDKKVGLEYEEYGMKMGREMTEAMSESAASRTSKLKRPNDIIKGYSRTSGYETMTFGTNLMAYSLGVTEKELLANGLGDKDEFLEFLKSKRPNSSREVLENELGLIESIFTIANKYPKGAITADFTEEEKSSNIKGFEHMYNRFVEMQRESILIDSRPLDMSVIGEMYSREKKLNSGILNSLEDLTRINYLDEEGKNRITQGHLNEKMAEIQKMILGRYVSYKRGFEPKSIEDKCARGGNLESLGLYYNDEEVKDLLGEFDGKNYAGIEQMMLTEAQEKPEFFEYLNKVRKEDFELNVIWDTKSYENLYKSFEQDKNKSREGEER